MSNLLKNTAKVAIGTCFTLGAVAVTASAVAGSNLGRVVSAAFKGAKTAVEDELAALKVDTASAETTEVPSADFEN